MWRIVDIADEKRELSLSRQSLKVSTNGQEIGRVSLADIQSVIVHSYSCVITVNLAVALSEAKIPIVLCDKNHIPVSLTLPVTGNFEHASRLQAQALLSLPKRKQLWRDLVQAKIQAQMKSLSLTGHADAPALGKLNKTVKSGDPNNIEARAARFYWPRLFGSDFRRNRDLQGINSHLNYGYTVLRSATARSVVAVGLAPGLGLHHRARLNPFQLIDDLMEPFRPLVDHLVWSNRNTWDGEVSNDAKRELANIINAAMQTEKGITTVSRVIAGVAMSLAKICTGDTSKLLWPLDWAIVDQAAFDFAD